MPKATWNNALLASYYEVVVGDTVNQDAAWYYPECKPEAKYIEGFVAFWKGVKVEEIGL